MDAPARHLRLLTETIAAVNSTLDLEEVLGLVARKVAEALEADACFVYLYDARADELVLRATHGTRVEEMTRRPKMRPGEGITGSAAAERTPIMIAAEAHLDPRFKSFSNLPEDEYESILAVPILAREKLAGALNVRTRRPREFTDAEVELLVAIAGQVAQTIEHAQLYADAQRRVGELEALARISEAVSESLYLEESLEAIVIATMEAVGATGAADKPQNTDKPQNMDKAQNTDKAQNADKTPVPDEARIRLQFTSPTKPALITGSTGNGDEPAPDYRYLVVPLRALAGA